MVQLAAWLRQWAVERVASDPRFAGTTFIISDAFEPGEGEHKVRAVLVCVLVVCVCVCFVCVCVC
jgi:5'-3' exonuclease